jgi:Zn-dependent protease with chaperone function
LTKASTRHPRPSAYRHWLEQPVLALTLAILVATPLFFIAAAGNLRFTITAGDLPELVAALGGVLLVFLLVGALSIVIGIAITFWAARRRLRGLRRSAVRIGPEQFPALHALAQAARSALDIATPVDLYLVERAPWLTLNLAPIAVLGVTKPYAIVISTTLLRDLGEDELRFLLGIEYGHVKLGHVRVLTLIDAVNGSLGRVPFVGGFIRLLFLGWTRLATFSADRAGLVAGGRLQAAYDTFGKLAVGQQYWAEVNHVALAQQASRTRGRFFDAANRTTVPFDTQPLGRFQRLAIFATSPAFAQLRPDADLSFPYLELWR